MKERFGRTGGRLLALLLAAAVTVSLAVPGALGALAGETGPNRILYDGSTVEGIHRMGGMDVEYAVREGAGYYGDALAINPTKMLGSGWAALPLSGAGELDFAAAKGIAMYVKIPAVTQTNFSIRLIDEGWSTWAEIGNSAELTYVSLDGTVQTKTQEPPFADMQGFEGFVFIPYEALSAGSTPGRAITEHMQADGWNIEFGYYKRNADEIGPDYLYDCIGFYSDIDAYIALARDQIPGPNQILYDGSTVEGIHRMGGMDVEYAVREGAGYYGDALAINPTKMLGSGWAALPLSGAGELDFAAAKGIAMYVKIPAVTQTNFSIRLIDEGWSTWAEIGNSAELTYVSLDGTVQTKTQEPPFADMQGFEGFVFIPYEALSAGSTPGRAITEHMQADGWNIEFGYYKRNADEIGPDYLYDCIGFYSDIDAYIAAADAANDRTNPVLYDGASVKGIAHKGGADVSWSVVKDASSHGSALAINPTKTMGSGWAALSLAGAAGVDFSALSGIAMYVKIPDVTQTNFMIRLIDDGWTTWAEVGDSAELTYVSLDGTVETKTQAPPFADMQGFEGFVFIPYESLTAGSTPGRAITEHMQAAGWNIEIGYYKRNEDEIGPNYLYDNIGLYTDIEGYIAAAGRVVEHPDEEPDDPGFEGGEWVANAGDPAGITVGHGEDIAVKQAAAVSKYGKGVAINPTKVEGGGWAAVAVNKPEGFDFRGTKGVVTYVRFPEGVTATNLTIRLIKNDWSAWYEVGTGITVTLVDKNGVKTEKGQTLPFENLQGYEGYVFIPYEALYAGSSPTVDTAALNDWTDWSIEIGYYKRNADEIGPDYIFYSFGFYTDVDAYVAAMDARHPNFVANTGTMDGVRITGGSTTEPDKDIAVEVREDATQFGDALSIYPKKTYSGNLAAIPVHKPEGFDFSKTKGLAVYIKFPTTAMATNLSIRLIKDDWSQWFEIGTSVTLTTLSVMGEKKSVSQFLPFEDMQGFEGFVFIPYEALYAGSPGQVDFDLLNSWEDWSIEIGYYKPNEADANVDYLYDNFGFYSDPEEYAALCGFVAQDKPSDDVYFNFGTDDLGWYLVNNMLDTGATTFGGFGAAVSPTADTPDGAGLLVAGQKAFRVALKNFRAGDSRLKGTAGLLFYIRADEAVAGLDFTIGLVDETNPDAVELYEFDSYEGDYYYAPTGGRLYKVSRDAIRLPAGFEGVVYFPFETFLPAAGSVPDNLKVDPDGVTRVTIAAEPNNAEQGDVVFTLDNLSFYASQDQLETMVGAPCDPRDFQVSATGAGSEFVTLTGDALRVYDPAMTYEKLQALLTVSGDVSLRLLDAGEQPVKPGDTLAPTFLLAVLRGETIVARIPGAVVTKDVPDDQKTLVQPGKPAVPDKTVTVDRVVVDVLFEDDPAGEESEPDAGGGEGEDALLTVKRSAQALVELGEGSVTVRQNMAATRFFSAFNVPDGVTLSLADTSGAPCAGGAVVADGFTLIATKADGEEVRYTVRNELSQPADNPTPPASSQAGQSPEASTPVWVWILVAAGAVLVIAAAVLAVVLVRKRKQTQADK